MYSSILFFFASLRVFILSLSPVSFFSCAPATFLSINSIPTFFLQSQPKLHVRVTNFNCHFIIATLESQNSVAQIQEFFFLKKYLIDPVMSWFVKSSKSCLSFSCCQSCRALAPRTCFKLLNPLSRIISLFYFSLLGIRRQQ